MHGKNISRPREVHDKDFSLQVAEVFYTIQGEGPFSGMPAVFVRLTGCPLRCHFCDTVWDDDNDPRRALPDLVKEIVELAKPMQRKLVVITGGEPLRQDLGPLVRVLAEFHDMTVQVETSGLYWQECLHLTTIVCSPKTKAVHSQIYDHCNHWKYIIRNGETSEIDGLPNSCTQEVDPKSATEDVAFPIFKKYGMPARPPARDNITVWVSPCDEGNLELTGINTRSVAAIALDFGYRAQIQLHKVLDLR